MDTDSVSLDWTVCMNCFCLTEGERDGARFVRKGRGGGLNLSGFIFAN